MDQHELRGLRLKRGLTQDQVANAIDTAHVRQQEGHRWDQGENPDRITQSMISQMETGVVPIPRGEREASRGKLPSIHDALVELFSLSAPDLHVRVGESERGPYRPRERHR